MDRAVDRYQNAFVEVLRDALVDESANVIPFLKQSASVLDSVASQMDNMKRLVVDFVFPSSLPSRLDLQVDYNSATDSSTSSWDPPATESASSASPPTIPPAFLLAASNTTEDDTHSQLIAAQVTMQGLPPFPLLVSTVHKEISFMSNEAHAEPAVCAMVEASIPSTVGFLRNVAMPARPNDLPYARDKSNRLHLNVEWNRAALGSLYPEVLHIIDCFASLSILISSSSGSEVATFALTPSAAVSSVAVTSSHLAPLAGGPPILFDPLSPHVALVQVDAQVYFARWGLLSFQLPRVRLRLRHFAQDEEEEEDVARGNEEGDGGERGKEEKKAMGAGNATQRFLVTIDSVENAGGYLSYILPLRRLSAYLSSVFLLDLKLTPGGVLSLGVRFQHPHLPRWVVSVAKMFVASTSGGGIKILRDFVCAMRDDCVALVKHWGSNQKAIKASSNI